MNRFTLAIDDRTAIARCRINKNLLADAQHFVHWHATDRGAPEPDLKGRDLMITPSGLKHAPYTSEDQTVPLLAPWPEFPAVNYGERARLHSLAKRAAKSARLKPELLEKYWPEPK